MDFNLSTQQLDQKAKVQYQSVYHDFVDMYFSIYIQRLLTRMNFPIPSAQRDSKTALLAGRSPAALKKKMPSRVKSFHTGALATNNHGQTCYSPDRSYPHLRGRFGNISEKDTS